MAYLYQRVRTYPIPPNAEFIYRKAGKCARWTDKRGKVQTALLNAAGDKIERKEDRWTIEFTDFVDGQEIRRTTAGFTDKQATQILASKLELEADLRQKGLIDRTLEKIAENEHRQLNEFLEDFRDYLDGKGGTVEHIDKTMNYIQVMFRECGFTTLATLDAGKVLTFLGGLKQRGYTIRTYQTKKGPKEHHVSFGVRAFNANLTAIKSFSRWLYTTGQSRTDAMITLKRDTKGERMDKRHPRRALSDEEIGKLIQSAENGPVVYGLTGPDRAVVYRLALGSGLRANEIRTLTARSFNLADLDQATVTVLAAYSKNRQDATLPIRRDLAELMKEYISSKMKLPDAILFPLPDRTAEMIQVDLKAAGISFEVKDGAAVDFHALRHTFISQLARSGVTPKVAQVLARHSTITMTMDRYTHILNEDQRDALNRLPEITVPAERNKFAATGTEDETPGEVGRNFGCITPVFSDQNMSIHANIQGKGISDYSEKANTDIMQGNGHLDKVYQHEAIPAMMENMTGPCRTRTCDPVIMSHLL